MKLVWDEDAGADYLWWQAQDRKVLKRINILLQDTPGTGTRGSATAQARLQWLLVTVRHR
jgi:toxin YoeB